MNRARISLAALALCALFTAAAAQPAPDPALQEIDRLTDLALSSEHEALHAIPLLVSLTRVNDPHVRINAAESLSYIARKYPAVAQASFSALATMINDPYADVLLQVARSIGHLGARNPAVAAEAITLLGFVVANKSAAPFVRANAMDGISGIPESDPALAARALDALGSALRDSNSDLRAAAAQSVWAAYLGLPIHARQPAVDALIPLANDPDSNVRAVVDRYKRLIMCTKVDANACLAP